MICTNRRWIIDNVRHKCVSVRIIDIYKWELSFSINPFFEVGIHIFWVAMLFFLNCLFFVENE
jgi:hypothetical protein